MISSDCSLETLLILILDYRATELVLYPDLRALKSTVAQSARQTDSGWRERLLRMRLVAINRCYKKNVVTEVHGGASWTTSVTEKLLNYDWMKPCWRVRVWPPNIEACCADCAKQTDW
ncbi:hypothetical protein MPL3365_130541 [Mesorhizobium plurifarium]|uniref:Uncharacterized protein n=1 Tax=Mesorhizobium plurifarium TaxID=69974 RepID=A0A090G3R9_MESPL|nr:hypothetical protein MPL3365_130541 [Mesorhizobium plurifarium]